MGGISIMARRLTGGWVQYGWCGNGGYFTTIGCRLSEWYKDPDDVDYLFDLGQTHWIGKKGSEEGGYNFYDSHHPADEPCWLGKSEKDVYKKLACIDFVYFYDLDNKWYYIIPSRFNVKVPFGLMENALEDKDEFDFRDELMKKTLEYMFTEYKNDNADFANFLKENNYDADEVLNKSLNFRYIFSDFSKEYRKIYEYFDEWVVIKTNENETVVKKIVLRKKEEKHVETCEW